MRIFHRQSWSICSTVQNDFNCSNMIYITGIHSPNTIPVRICHVKRCATAWQSIQTSRNSWNAKNAATKNWIWGQVVNPRFLKHLIIWSVRPVWGKFKPSDTANVLLRLLNKRGMWWRLHKWNMRLHWLLSSRLLWLRIQRWWRWSLLRNPTFHLSHLSSSLVMIVFPTVSFPVTSLSTIQANVGLVNLSWWLPFSFTDIWKLAFHLAFAFVTWTICLRCFLLTWSFLSACPCFQLYWCPLAQILQYPVQRWLRCQWYQTQSECVKVPSCWLLFQTPLHDFKL